MIVGPKIMQKEWASVCVCVGWWMDVLHYNPTQL
jgi:hypothetical protein